MWWQVRVYMYGWPCGDRWRRWEFTCMDGRVVTGEEGESLHVRMAVWWRRWEFTCLDGRVVIGEEGESLHVRMAMWWQEGESLHVRMAMKKVRVYMSGWQGGHRWRWEFTCQKKVRVYMSGWQGGHRWRWEFTCQDGHRWIRWEFTCLDGRVVIGEGESLHIRMAIGE